MAEKQRILIVDDDANIAELISLYLTKECFETQIVGDGEEALKAFPVFKPNLVLLDLMLPGMRRLPGLPGAARLRPRFPSSCCPPRARSSTRCWAWSWAPTIT